MDQPFVNSIQPGSVVTIQIKPDDNFIKRGGWLQVQEKLGKI